MKNLICAFLLFPLFLAAEAATANPLSVLVTVGPQGFLVKQIGQEFVDVHLLVPPGSSAHTFEPTPKQMLQSASANIWFRIGEPFETKALAAFKSFNPAMEVVDLRRGLSLISDDHICPHCKASGGEDLHFWLSPELDIQQAETITRVLSARLPEQKMFFEKRFGVVKERLQEISQKIQSILSGLKARTVFVSHPAYAYFAREFGLKQLSIEVEGKDPTPLQLHRIVEEARALQIKRVYTQKQYPSKGAHLIAEALSARVVDLDPYAENLYESLIVIAEVFALNGTP